MDSPTLQIHIHIAGSDRPDLGIACNAKPIVQQHAQASISIYNLELILYFLGISGKELKELRKAMERPGS